MSPTRKRPPNDKPLRGRRGGRTTVTETSVRKTFWIDRDLEDRLREHSYRTGRPESELVREAIRRYYESGQGG